MCKEIGWAGLAAFVDIGGFELWTLSSQRAPIRIYFSHAKQEPISQLLYESEQDQ